MNDTYEAIAAIPAAMMLYTSQDGFLEALVWAALMWVCCYVLIREAVKGFRDTKRVIRKYGVKRCVSALFGCDEEVEEEYLS